MTSYIYRDIMNRDEILKLAVNGLKEKLTELGLSVTGRKTTLQDRLLEYFGQSLDDDDVGNEGSEYGGVGSLLLNFFTWTFKGKFRS